MIANLLPPTPALPENQPDAGQTLSARAGTVGGVYGTIAAVVVVVGLAAIAVGVIQAIVGAEDMLTGVLLGALAALTTAVCVSPGSASRCSPSSRGTSNGEPAGHLSAIDAAPPSAPSGPPSTACRLEKTADEVATEPGGRDRVELVATVVPSMAVLPAAW